MISLRGDGNSWEKSCSQPDILSKVQLEMGHKWAFTLDNTVFHSLSRSRAWGQSLQQGHSWVNMGEHKRSVIQEGKRWLEENGEAICIEQNPTHTALYTNKTAGNHSKLDNVVLSYVFLCWVEDKKNCRNNFKISLEFLFTQMCFQFRCTV